MKKVCVEEVSVKKASSTDQGCIVERTERVGATFVSSEAAQSANCASRQLTRLGVFGRCSRERVCVLF